MVTPPGLDEPPTWSTTGTGPGVRPVGICTFTWRTPDTIPGAPPANCGLTDRPARVTVTGNSGTGKGGADGLTAPSWVAGFVRPPPVAYRLTKSPALAGRSGPLIEPSELTATAWPRPLPSRLKRPGALGATLTVRAGATRP